MENFLKFVSSNLQYITIILVFIITYAITPLRKYISLKIKKIIGLKDINDTLTKMSQQLQDVSNKNNLQNEKIDILSNKMEEHIKDDEIRKDIQKSQLKNDLQKTFKFYINKNYATVDEKNVVQELYESGYKNYFHGNGIIDYLWSVFKELPDDTNKKKDE